MQSPAFLRYLLVLVLFVTVADAKEYLHAKLKAKEVRVQRIILLPVVVDVAKQGVKGGEGMGEEADKSKVDLGSVIATAPTSLGFSVEAPFSEEALRGNDELKYMVANVQSEFDQLSPRLFDKKKDVRKGRCSLGDIVASLNTKGDADAVLFVRSQGTKQTKGRGFLGGGLIGMMSSGAINYHTWIALVDASSGDLLFLSETTSRNLPKEKVLMKGFKKIPLAVD